MSTTIIYNPRSGERESRTSRIRRSRKRPLGEAASSPSSATLVRNRRRRRCGCVVAAARSFSSATGQKPCTIPAQQHRPRGSPNQERGGQPRRATASPASPLSLSPLSSLSLSLSLSLPPSLALCLFFFFSSLDPSGGEREPVAPVRLYMYVCMYIFPAGDQPWKRKGEKKTGNPTSGAPLGLLPAFSQPSGLSV